MPFFIIDDQLPVNRKFQALVERGDASSAWAVTLWTLAGANAQASLSDGRVSSSDLVRLLLDRRRAAAAAARLTEVGLWHAAGHECDLCPAIDSGYVFHDWGQMRYTAGEKVKETRAVRRELKDPAVREAVRLRDGDRCRYCGHRVNWNDRRSPRAGTYDHVQPGKARGPENLVVACRKCNQAKQDRTPDRAGMTLKPPPSVTGSDPVTDPVTIQFGPRKNAVHGHARAGDARAGQGQGQGSGKGDDAGSAHGRTPGPAGAVPDSPGRFGSAYHGWTGPPDREPDAAVCPDHALDLPCRRCRDVAYADDDRDGGP